MSLNPIARSKYLRLLGEYCLKAAQVKLESLEYSHFYEFHWRISSQLTKFAEVSLKYVRLVELVVKKWNMGFLQY
ncbi:hypothetical protein MNBD_ALPHA11-1914 [hydrothermal vent metagenome]|uniref:Uncharacterized protein n=1 Tax=hydrothermal vent metagenome TaxID=652676 RepID=A0A3B0TTN8_9ZZZZ